MNKAMAVLLASVVGVVGFSLGRLVADVPEWPELNTPTSAPVSDYSAVAPVVEMSSTEAKDLRASHYTSLSDVSQILELPGDFAQTEALYAVAGRASRGELESLIVQAIAIADRFDRRAALSILFGRYLELDPSGAVDFLLSLNLDIDDQLLTAMFESWTKEDPAAAIAKANVLTNTRLRQRAAHAVLTAFSRLNPALLEQAAEDLDEYHDLTHHRAAAIALRANAQPALALREALASNSQQGRFTAVNRVAQVWARNDPLAALDALDQISDPNMQRQFSDQVLNRWVADEPQQALDYVMNYPPGTRRNQMLSQALGHFAEQSPDEAVQLALQLEPAVKHSVMSRIASRWAAQDPAAAINGLMAIDDQSLRQQALETAGQNLAMRAPDRAIEWLNSLDGTVREQQMASVLSTLAQHSPRVALDYALTHVSGATRESLLGTILQRVSDAEPELALDYVGELPSSELSFSMLETIARRLAQKDAENTLQWISTLSGTQKSRAVRGAAMGLVSTNPAASSRLIAQLPETEANDIIYRVGTRMAFQNPQGAIDWLAPYSGTPGYDRAITSVSQAIAQTDPQRALTLASTLSEQSRIQATSSVLHAWSRSNPTAAAQWARNAPAELQSSAVSSVAQTWAQSDPMRAMNWALTLPSGESQELALVAVAGSMPPEPAQVSQVIGRLSDDHRRDAIIMAFRRIEYTNGRQAANAFLDQIDATANERAMLGSSR